MKKIVIIAVLLFVIYPVVGHAADEYNIAYQLQQTNELPIASVLAKLIINISATAKIVSAVMIMVTFLMLAFGELSQTAMTITRIVFSISLLVHIGSIVSSTMFATNDITVNVDANLPANMTSDNFMGNFMDYYIAICKRGAAALSKYLYLLTFGFATLDIVWTLALRPEQDIFKYIFSNVLKIGFFVWLISNWVTGDGLAHAVSATFEFLAQIAAGQAPGTGVTPDQIYNNGYKLMSTCWEQTLGYAGLTTIGLFVFHLFITVGVIACIIITSLYLLLARLEFWTMAIMTLILVPFGMLSQTRFLFEKAIGGIFNCSVKIGAISFVSFVVFTILTGLSQSSTNASGFGELLRVLLACMVVALMVMKCPTIVQGLITGSPSLSNGDFMAPAQAAARTAASAYSGGMSQLGKMATARAMAGVNSGGIKGALGVAGRTLSARAKMGLSSFKDPYHDAITRADSRMEAQGKHNILMSQAKTDSTGGEFGAFDYSKTAIYKRMTREGTKTPGQDVSGDGN